MAKSLFKYEKYSYCLNIFHSTKSKNDLKFGFSISKQLENTLFQQFICSHTPETNFQVALQQWQYHGSRNKSNYNLLLEDLPLNQMQNWFDIWIQHIKTIRKHSLSVIICSHTSETNFQVTLQQWQQHGSGIKNTHHLLFENVPLNQKQKCFDNGTHHIKTLGKHSLSVIDMLPYTNQKLISK